MTAMHVLKCLLRLATLAAFVSGVGAASAVSLTPVTLPALWSRLEFSVDGVAPVTNAFDPDLIAVDATITLPSGAARSVPAFWYQPYIRSLSGGYQVLKPSGSPGWRLRVMPEEVGNYQLVLTVRTNGQIADASSPTKFTVPPPATLPVGPLGFGRVSAGSRFFQTSGGDPLPLSGACVSWYHNGGTYDYDHWFAGLQGGGENYTRLWMAPWAFGIEAETNTLTHYRMDRAWELDYVLSLAEAKGIYIMLCLDFHGMFEVTPDYWGGNNFWPSNPYNVARGGPCANQDAFFTNPAASTIYQKRMRYLIARYGYSTHLLAWEFFNEIDNVYAYLNSNHVAAWHAQMGTWLHAHDPSRHLVTTSFSSADGHSEIWGLPQIDYTMYHSYGAAKPATTLASIAATFVQSYQKPIMIAEFGTDWRGWNQEQDRFFRGWRQGIWGGALGGSVGTAMSWWWENIDSLNLYPRYQALSQFMAKTQWGKGNWTPLSFQTNGDPPPTVGPKIPGGEPFTALLKLDPNWGSKPRGQAAVPDDLAAQSAGSFLNGFVHGTGHPELRIPFRIEAWFSTNAQLILHLNSVSDGAVMTVWQDGTNIFSKALPNIDGTFQVNEEYNQDFGVAIALGKHDIEIRNTGGDWFFLDWVELVNILPAQYSNGWSPSPGAIGLRGDSESLLYVVSPMANFPANSTNAVIDTLKAASVVITSAPAGRYQALWYDPATAAYLGETEAVSDGARLAVPLPDFAEDLAGRLRLVSSYGFEQPAIGTNGLFQAVLVAGSNLTFELEASSDLRSWNPLLQLTNSAGGELFQDPASSSLSRRFYRGRLLP